VEWRGRLLLYLLDDGDQRFYVLHGGRFLQVMDATFTLPALADLYSVGGELVIVNTQDAADGVSVTRNKQDAVFTSSWLDMGRPTQEKHLVDLAAVVSDDQADFKVKIEYRIQSDAAWTQAVETANSRHVIAEDLGVDFYLLQLRVTFDDDSGSHHDIELESIAATYVTGR
jgi:hypothetical protein